MNSLTQIDKFTLDNNMRLDPRILTYILALKFVSDNSDKLGVESDKFKNFDALTKLYGSSITDKDFIDYAQDIDNQLYQKYTTRFEFDFAISSIISKFPEYNELFKIISSMNLRDDDNCVLASCLLENFANEDFYGCCSYYELSKLLVELADVEDRTTVYDGYVGYGSFLVECIKSNPNLSISAQDVNRDAHDICKLILLLCGYLNANITNNNSFTEYTPYKFDAIISAPPLALKIDNEIFDILTNSQSLIYSDLLSKRIDLTYVVQAISRLNDNGVALLQLTNGCMFQTGKVLALRKQLLLNGHIKAVIQLPSGNVTGSRVPTVILIVGVKSDNTDVFLFNADSDDFAENIITSKRGATLTNKAVEEIVYAYRNKINIANISKLVTIDEIESNEYILTPNVYTNQRDCLNKAHKPLDELIKREQELIKLLGEL